MKVSDYYVNVAGQELQVLINDKPAKQFAHEGKSYIIAPKGEYYTLKVKNHSSKRVLAVVSADGINVISGEPASQNDTGYIIEGYSSEEIKGFRTSSDSVNAFLFSDKEKSYAANNEANDFTDQNCGVISVVIWSEKEKGWSFNWDYAQTRPQRKPFVAPPYEPYPDPYEPTYPWERNPVCPKSPYIWYGALNQVDTSESTTRCFQANQTKCVDFDTGTEFSDKVIVDRVREEEFERGAVVTQLSVYYASKQALRKMGVPIDREKKVSAPEPFPKDNGKYCTPPRKQKNQKP